MDPQSSHMPSVLKANVGYGSDSKSSAARDKAGRLEMEDDLWTSREAGTDVFNMSFISLPVS